jgi:hypothetical protein
MDRAADGCSKQLLIWLQMLAAFVVGWMVLSMLPALATIIVIFSTVGLLSRFYRPLSRGPRDYSLSIRRC